MLVVATFISPMLCERLTDLFEAGRCACRFALTLS